MSILITGTGGFIGCRVLEKMRDIYSNDRIVAMSSAKCEGVRFLNSQSYMFDEGYLVNNCPDIDTILHIGAFTPKSGKEVDNILFTTENVTNTLNLINAADKLMHLRKIVFISTLDVYTQHEDIISESTSTDPQTMYGWSKLYCEKMVESFCLQREIEYNILRLGHVYGEGEEKYRKVMPIMINLALNGNNIEIYGSGKALRTYIYIDDVVKAIVNSINHNKNEVINIVGKEPVSINHLADMIVSMSGKKVEIIHKPSDIPDRNLLFDNTKLMNTLLNDLTPFEEGLKKEVEYMKGRAI